MPNASGQMMTMGLATLEFRWEEGGSMAWDYKIRMMRVWPYAPAGSLDYGLIVLQVLVGLFVACDVVMSVRDIAHHVRHFMLGEYLLSPAAWLDWTSHALHIYFWLLWALFIQDLGRFELLSPGTYSLLATPNSDARWLATDAEGEHAWLQLVLRLGELLDAEAHCFAILGFALLVCLLRFIAACHFQPKWANVTGTLQAMIPDTINYLILYFLIVGGYACVGMLLFGHQVETMSSWGVAMQALLDFLLTMDYEAVGWAQMEHAAADALTFHLFMWTFVVIGFLILFNIFLCIVIDAYMASKEEMEATMMTSVAQDLSAVGQQLWRMLTKPQGRFWSDGKLQEKLRQQDKSEGIPPIRDLREYITEAFRSHTKATMTLKSEEGGIVFSTKDVARLTKPPEVYASLRACAWRASERAFVRSARARRFCVYGVTCECECECRTADPTAATGSR